MPSYDMNGGGGYNQGGYNQGGYNQGGYNQGGYNQGPPQMGGPGYGGGPPMGGPGYGGGPPMGGPGYGGGPQMGGQGGGPPGGGAYVSGRPYSGTSGHSQISSISGGSKSKNAAEVAGVNFIGGLDRRYLCPVCSNVLRYPVQFDECGHRVCSSCLPELLRVAPRCPIDQVKVERDRVFVDKAFQSEIEALKVKCSNEARGCQWIGLFKELQAHLEDCRYGTCPCPRACGVDLERRFVQKHLDEDCTKRGVRCEFCQAEIAFEDEIDHYNTCGKFRVPCPNGCKMKEIPREQVEQHLATECPKQKVSCPFAEAGCDFKAERKQMDKHVREDPAEHLSKLCDLVMKARQGMDEQSLVVKKVGDRVGSVEKRVEHLEKMYGSQLIWKVDGYTEKVNESKAGTKPTIFSPPFLTSRHGYKLALSACLYGDGKVRGKNMSIFICICKGEYDPLLQWPFSHRVTFTLVDQALDPASRRNVSYSIKPNTCKENKPFLSRPLGERNASFGAQKFCELDILNTRDYIRDDTIYIKVDVDSDEMVSV